MMTTQRMAGLDCNDAELVADSLKGNRDAFGQIVARYQSLVCSLAYSATGSLSQSEDLAQETFVTAWKHLPELREPLKLRSWLCGITRNLIGKTIRRDIHEPTHFAEPIDAAQDIKTSAPLPPEQVIGKEEEAILWRSLAQIPEMYREPLVLFYREHHSIEAVAEALDLSTDAVKQRLSRGRKLLHEQVLAFVEGALERTNPGKAFTLGVLASLPVFTSSASAATIGAAAVEGSAAAKASSLLGISGAILGPFAGILGAWVGVKAGLAQAQSERERQFIRASTKQGAIFMAAYCLLMFSLIFVSRSMWQRHGATIALGLVAVNLAYVGTLLIFIFKWNSKLRSIRLEEGAAGRNDPKLANVRSNPIDYRSKWSLFGLPLLHIRTGKMPEGSRRAARGWIAVGDIACGGIAVGGVSVGVISLGGISIGLLSLGGDAVGFLAFGGLGIGYWSIAGCAVGYFAFGGVAAAWKIAVGGLAAAREFALGGAAFAPFVNNAVARSAVQSEPFFLYAQYLMQHTSWLVWLPIITVFWQFRRMRKLQRSSHGSGKSPRVLFGLLPILILSLCCACRAKSSSEGSASNSTTLSNGIHVVSIQFPASTNVSIFTFLPLGLTFDSAGQAQWSHLIEHLVIRSTIPAASPQANAETLADHMRLDFYGNTNNWKEGLAHHRRWISRTPFSEDHLEAEKLKVINEGDFTARNFATHKFALAAWSHGLRHRAKHVALKGDVTRAQLRELEALRDNRLALSNQVTVCVVGGLDSKIVLDAVKNELGSVALGPAPEPSSSQLQHESQNLTWDLNARHLLLTWPIPDFRKADYAPLLVAAQKLNIQFASAPDLRSLTGMTFAGADLTTPEGSYFFVSASLRPNADFSAIQQALLKEVEQLTSKDNGKSAIPLIARQLASSIENVPDLQLLKNQMPPGISPAMVEGNIGLQMGMHVHRYGDKRLALAKVIQGVALTDVERVVRKYLPLDKVAVWTVRPASAKEKD